ncbi:MAG: response regulator transcription factor [Desulfobacteraceae bacterium]|nr:response regulator transcription factor [Desulfobacteraceae bacterium]
MMNEQPSILVVEDDDRLAGLIKDYLGQQGYDVSVERRGDKVLSPTLFDPIKSKKDGSDKQKKAAFPN